MIEGPADMKPPRSLSIAVVTGSASRMAGGLFNSVRRLSLGLSELGHKVTVLAVHDEHTVEDLGAWLPLVPLASRPAFSAALRYTPGIGRALRQGNFDVVHQHGIWQGFSPQVSAWRRRTGGVVMISPRGMLDQWALQNASWKKRLAAATYERENLASASCLHALNASEARSIRAFGLDNPIAIIPNGIDLPEARDQAPPDWWPEENVLLFVGRLHQKKGLVALLEAYAQLSRSSPKIAENWRLVIAGWDDGGHGEVIRAEVANRGLSRKVILTGAIYGDQKDAALRHARAFVLPSYSEGLPMSVLEAWAYSLPVFMTDACNLPEGFTARAAERIPVDPSELAARLETLLSEDRTGDLDAMGHRGRALVEHSFGWKSIVEQHMKVYEWLTNGSTRPSCVLVD